MVNSEAWIERWRAGDERAAEAIYNHYRNGLFRLAYVLLGDREDAEEVMQDALNYALVNIHRYRPEQASFKTWLNTIAVSRCRDRQRRKLLPRLSLTAWLRQGHDVADPALRPEQNATVNETHHEIWQAVQALKPALREAIYLRHWADHTYQEIGAILGCPIPTAQSRVKQAHETLRNYLLEKAGEGVASYE